MVISFGYLGLFRNNPSYPSYKKQLRTWSRSLEDCIKFPEADSENNEW